MNKSVQYFLVMFSLPLAMVLSLFPMTSWLSYVRPEWVMLSVFFLLLSKPDTLGVSFAFSIGLLVDVLEGTTLGQHGLAFTLVSFILVSTQNRFINFPVMQQAIVVALLTVLSMFVVLVGTVISTDAEFGIKYFGPALSSLVLWPLISQFIVRQNKMSVF